MIHGDLREMVAGDRGMFVRGDLNDLNDLCLLHGDLYDIGELARHLSHVWS